MEPINTVVLSLDTEQKELENTILECLSKGFMLKDVDLQFGLIRLVKKPRIPFRG